MGYLASHSILRLPLCFRTLVGHSYLYLILQLHILLVTKNFLFVLTIIALELSVAQNKLENFLI